MTKQEMILRQQAIVDKAKAEKRDLTAEEQADYDSLQRSIEAPDTQPTPDNKSIIEGERKRSADITTLCRGFGMDPSKHIADGSTVDQVRAAILDNMQRDGAPIATNGRAEVGMDEADKFRQAAADSLILRSGMTLAKPAEGASELKNLSFRDMAIECMSKGGGENLTRKSPDELFSMLQERQYFSPTANFPAILDMAIEKSYKEGHNNVAVTFDKWTKKGSLKDFKTHDNNYLAGPAGEFLEVPENGELKHDTRADVKLPTRKLKTYGRQFTLTRQAFINDDIDLITKLPAKYAASARKTINTQVYKILVSNPAVYDGTPLFSTAHRNILATGTGVTLAAMQHMIMALQTQKDQFDQAIIIRPATIIVPAGCAFDMYTLFNSPTINTSGNTQAVNPLFGYRENIEVVEDPTINVLCGGFGNTMPWWLVGATSDTDFIEVDYLNGEEIPKIRRMETAGTLGFVWDIYLDWGISVMDVRGAIKNPGTVIADPLA